MKFVLGKKKSNMSTKGKFQPGELFSNKWESQNVDISSVDILKLTVLIKMSFSCKI